MHGGPRKVQKGVMGKMLATETPRSCEEAFSRDRGRRKGMKEVTGRPASRADRLVQKPLRLRDASAK